MIEDKTQFLEWSRREPALAAGYQIALIYIRRQVLSLSPSRHSVPASLRQKLR